MNLNKLHNAIEKVCPIHGVSIGNATDKTTWQISFKDEATAEEKAAAKAVIDNWNISSWMDIYGKRYDEVTNKTAAVINSNGFVYNGVPFYTDATAQQNFTALLIMKDGLTYPFAVWDGNNVVALADDAELTNFCGQLFVYIAAKRTEGKTIRDGLLRQEGETDTAYSTRLENFIDPRI